jgi:uncharacterized protein YdhG (YjbR/CyaY superfamily)
MSPALMKELKSEMKNFDTTTATIHFSHEKPLPAKLIRKIVEKRIKENESRIQKKKK